MRSVKEELEEEEQDTDEREEGVVEEIQDETVAYYQWWPKNKLGVKKNNTQEAGKKYVSG